MANFISGGALPAFTKEDETKWFLQPLFLGGDDATESDLEDFILGANPEQLVQIKASDNEFKLKMEEIGVDVFKLEVADKGNAREHNKDSSMPAVLSLALTVFIIGIVCALFYMEPPEGARNVLFMLLGVVIKEWSNSMHYWYGTTRSSQEKTKLLK